MQCSLQPLKEAQCARVARGPFPAMSPRAMCSRRDTLGFGRRMLAGSSSQRSPCMQSSEPREWRVPWTAWEGGQLALWAPPSSCQPRACPGEVFQGPQDSLGSPGCGCVNCSHPAKSGSGHLSPWPQPHRGQAPLPSSWPPGRSDDLSRCLWESCSALLPASHCSTGSPLGHFTFSPDPCNSGKTFPGHKATLLQLVSGPHSQSSGQKSRLQQRPQARAGL